MPQPQGLAARAAHWSARHRKTAILGWIAFVIAATMIGGSIGTKKIADEDLGNGSSKVADQAIAHADFPDKDGEQVLVQSRDGARATDPAFKGAVADVTRASRARRT